MGINKEKIHDRVEIFYQSPFKTFYINSVDGVEMIKPFGVFVSLGITTSLDMIKKVRDGLAQDASTNYKTSLVEIVSKSIGGQYLNYVIPHEEPEIHQYKVTRFPESVMTLKEAREKMIQLKSEMKLQEAFQIERSINKIESDPVFSDDLVYRSPDGEYRVFCTHLNYTVDPETGYEYRIGIYVEEC